MRGRRILLIEDNRDIQAFVATMARMEAADLVTVSSGEDGLKTLERDRRFDLIILDINLPNMTGWEVIESLDGFEGHKPPVVVFTASADPETQQRAQEVGASGVIVKPIAVKELTLRLVEIFERGASAGEATNGT